MGRAPPPSCGGAPRSGRRGGRTPSPAPARVQRPRLGRGARNLDPDPSHGARLAREGRGRARAERSCGGDGISERGNDSISGRDTSPPFHDRLIAADPAVENQPPRRVNFCKRTLQVSLNHCSIQGGPPRKTVNSDSARLQTAELKNILI